MGVLIDKVFRPRKWENQLNSGFRGTKTGKVVIIAGGPSVKNLDVQRLSNAKVDVIAVNAVMICNEFAGLKPQFVAGMALDEDFLLKFHCDLMLRERLYRIFTGNSFYDNDGIMRVWRAMNIHRIPSNYSEGLGDDFTRFGNGGNSGHAAVQLAVVLGYDCIGLVGFDGIQEGQSETRFHRLYGVDGERIGKDDARLANEWCHALDGLKCVFDQLGVTLWNLSERSVLTRYGRYGLDDFLNAPMSEGRSRIHRGPVDANEYVGEFGHYNQANGCFGGASNRAVPGWYKAVPSVLSANNLDGSAVQAARGGLDTHENGNETGNSRSTELAEEISKSLHARLTKLCVVGAGGLEWQAIVDRISGSS